METVRLEKKSAVTKCSLELDPGVEVVDVVVDGEKAQHITEQVEGEGPCVCKPLILDCQQQKDSLMKNSVDKPDVCVATKLLFVMGGFLMCWLPYFVWLPTVHLLVRLIYISIRIIIIPL